MQQPTIVISLKERTDRRREMRRQLTCIGWHAEFFDAIRPTEAAGFPSIGARGCFLSHLGVIERARDIRLPCVVILEDDVNFHRDFPALWANAMSAIEPMPWSIFYAGHFLTLPSAGLSRLDPATGVMGAHFLAIHTSAYDEIIAGLRAMLARQPGHADGGPMHVDGAYSTLRARNVRLPTYAFSPSLGYQRSSRTDIGETRWFDRIPLIAPAADAARRLKAFVRPPQ